VHARRPVRLRALLTHIDEGWQRHVDVVDLGLGGARLATSEKLSSGDKVSLSFTAPTLWDPLVLRAKVAWAKSTMAGVTFEHKNPTATFALFELVATMGYEG
jgi:hypothetical protein